MLLPQLKCITAHLDCDHPLFGHHKCSASVNESHLFIYLFILHGRIQWYTTAFISDFILLNWHSTGCPVSWGCRIHQLLLCRGVRPPSNKCPGYDTKQSDDEVPVMLRLWGMWSTPSLPLSQSTLAWNGSTW